MHIIDHKLGDTVFVEIFPIARTGKAEILLAVPIIRVQTQHGCQLGRGDGIREFADIVAVKIQRIPFLGPQKAHRVILPVKHGGIGDAVRIADLPLHIKLASLDIQPLGDINHIARILSVVMHGCMQVFLPYRGLKNIHLHEVILRALRRITVGVGRQPPRRADAARRAWLETDFIIAVGLRKLVGDVMPGDQACHAVVRCVVVSGIQNVHIQIAVCRIHSVLIRYLPLLIARTRDRPEIVVPALLALAVKVLEHRGNQLKRRIQIALPGSGIIAVQPLCQHGNLRARRLAVGTEIAVVALIQADRRHGADRRLCPSADLSGVAVGLCQIHARLGQIHLEILCEQIVQQLGDLLPGDGGIGRHDATAHAADHAVFICPCHRIHVPCAVVQICERQRLRFHAHVPLQILHQIIAQLGVHRAGHVAIRLKRTHVAQSRHDAVCHAPVDPVIAPSRLIRRALGHVAQIDISLIVRFVPRTGKRRQGADEQRGCQQHRRNFS